MEKRIAPWPDFAGNLIREGDTIRHPDGQIGRVEFVPALYDDYDRWMVRYFVEDVDHKANVRTRLFLQISGRAQAVVIDTTPQPNHVRDAVNANR